VIDLQFYMKQSALPVASPKYAADKPAPPQVRPLSKEDQDRVVAELGKKGK
jgi:hypothetical protein